MEQMLNNTHLFIFKITNKKNSWIISYFTIKEIKKDFSKFKNIQSIFSLALNCYNLNFFIFIARESNNIVKDANKM